MSCERNFVSAGFFLLLFLFSCVSLVIPVYAEDGYSGGYMQMPTWLYNQRISEGATDTFSQVLGGPIPEPVADPTFEAYLAEGNAALEGGSYRDALKAFENAIGEKSNSFDAWVGRGFSLEALKRYQSAIDAFDQALSIRSSGENAWMAYGGKARCELALNQFANAAGTFEKAINSFEASGASDEKAFASLQDGLAEAEENA